MQAGLMLGLLVAIYLGPALVGARMLAPLSLLYQFVPWQQYAPSDIDNYMNALLFDVPASFYPWAHLSRDLLRAGTFPAWNPYALAGTPLFANAEIAWFNPFAAISWILPLNYSFGVAAALKLWVAGIGTYLLARELKLSLWPAVLGGTAFALCAFNVVWLTHGVHVSVAVTLPWLLWLIERIIRRGRSGTALALVAVSAVAFSGGHPGTQLHVMTAAAVYAIVRSATSDAAIARSLRLRRLAIVVACLALGALLLAVTLLPAALNTRDTIGAEVRSHGAPSMPGAALPVDAVRTALFPDWWGRPDAEQVTGPANYNERTFYAGAIALLLAMIALTSKGAWRRKLPIVAIGVLGLAVPLHLPGFHFLVVNLPLYEATQGQRMMLLFMLAVAILAAFGLQALLDAPARLRSAWLVIGGGAAVGLVAMMLVAPSAGATWDSLNAFGTRIGADSTALALNSVWWWLLFVGCLAAALVALRRVPRARIAIAAVIVLCAALDMLHFAGGYQPMGPTDKVIPPRTETVEFLARHDRDGRIAGQNLALVNDWSTVYRLRDARGYDAPHPSLRFYRLWLLLNPGQIGWQPLSFDRLTPAGMTVLSVLGVRHVVTAPGEPSAAFLLAGLRKVYEDGDAAVYANRAALPRAFVAPTVRVVDDEPGALRRMRDPAFDPRQEAVLERADPAARAVARYGQVQGSARVVRETNASVGISARLDRDGLVVLDDNLTPGWSVRVDGRETRVVRVNSVLRGVLVPAGTHRIEWHYSVPGLKLGLAGSGLGLLVVAGWSALLIRRRRSSRQTLTTVHAQRQ